jgi:hypothetical protein
VCFIEKINNPDLVAATLAAAVIQKTNFDELAKKDNHSSPLPVDFYACNAPKIFKDIYNSICNLNGELSQNLK